jgi:hypothetical protein
MSKRREKGVQDMGYMQDTDYKIQLTAYMPGCKIQDTETGYSVYSIEDAGHKVQDTGCSVQYTEYTRQDAIQGIRTKDLRTTLYRIQVQDHSVQNTRY